MEATALSTVGASASPTAPSAHHAANGVSHHRLVGQREVTEQTFARQIGTALDLQDVAGETELDSAMVSGTDMTAVPAKSMDHAGI